MNNKHIEELHRIREENYEHTKNVPFEEKQEKIRRGAAEFLKLVENVRQERIKM